jgi:KDO2-lipid IV(A) lauroyltransferase
MSKARSAVADWMVYAVVRLFVCLVQAMSLETARALARGLSWLAHRIDRRHRQVAYDNLHQAFPDRSEAELQRSVRAVFGHFCSLAIELIHLPRRVHPNNWRRYIAPKNGPLLVEWLLSGRALLFVTGHFGNWEIASYGLGLLGFKIYAIARPLDNPFLDNYLRRFRESTGQKLLAKKGDFDQIQEVLRTGGILGTLGDQDAGARGQFVDFFGRPASTHKAVALLALEHGVPLVVSGTAKIGEPMNYLVMIEDVILPQEYAGRPDAVPAITQRFTHALERIVRTAPEQYFWLHRRWKHQPARPRRRVA